ncbi:type IX secretion system membrane protein PorP/SprF [Mucilaginibacter sp. PPCGB 2223]|uniref:PorP/SprF family type IX secretion system membrane protein n=1 Tax=Mucilaginibacter sp. PPCGB 2223 TaxID=1886027 RepID=UPI0009F5AA22|nr:type IX secretion system membrane protein PorP/SprF [Mucilaginibacter sp. PPCGB 2223]
MNIKNTFTGLFTFAAMALSVQQGRAQLNPFQQGYYLNKYLADPSMAGINPGLNINAGYRQQWSSFPGTPKTQTLTADYQATDKVGLGLNISNDKAGLIQQTRIMATYAYHLPLSGNDQHLNFGLSLGVNDPFISTGSVNGDQSDVQIADYNSLKPYVDGDFGISYTSNHLTVEAAIPNLKANIFKNEDDRIDVDRTTFMTAASYKIQLPGNALAVEPKVMFRGVKGFDNILDAGVNFSMTSTGLSLQGIYHSNQNVGMGFAWEEHAFGLSFNYNLETGPVSTYSSGAFEFGLKIKLFNKAK